MSTHFVSNIEIITCAVGVSRGYGGWTTRRRYSGCRGYMQRNETTTRRGTLHCLENGPYTLVSCQPKPSREREREREREHNRNSLYGKELPHTILHQRGHEVKDSIQINVATQNKSRATYKDKISTNFATCTVNLAQHLEVTLLIETLSPSRTRQESTETDQT